ncbi:MAG: nitrous oxide reductase family maturation protein NosD [Halobacteriales archaeon]
MLQRTMRDALVVAVVLVTILAPSIAAPVNAMPDQPDSNEQSVHLIPPATDEQTGSYKTRLVAQQQRVSTTSTLVVEKSNPNNFDSIQNAVENATDGDTVEVRPGTYREKVSFNKTLTLTAPSGATLNGSTINTLFVDNAVTLEQAADGTVISGFTITNYGGDGITVNTGEGKGVTIRGTTITNNGNGIDGDGTSSSITIRDSTLKNNDPANLWSRFGEADWTVENTTLRDGVNDNIRIGTNQPGNWTILSSTITGAGITAAGNTLGSAPEGDWTIRDTTISGSDSHGVNADENAKDWTIQNTTIDSADIFGVNAEASTGNWTITNSTIKKSNKRGIWAKGATGNWTVRNATITSNGDEGVLATDITGAWTITQSRITNNTGNGINANNAAIEIDATQNWWGDASGPSDTDCVGNVKCTDWLTSPSGGTTPDDGDGGNTTTTKPFSLSMTDATTTPNSTVTVEFNFTNQNDTKLTGPALKVIQHPSAWTITSHEDAGSTYSESSGVPTWLWLQIGVGSSKKPTITFKVPNSTASGNYTVTGQAVGPDDTIINQSGTVTVSEETTKTITDEIAGEDETIGIVDIQRAIRLWANNQAVPNTGGKTIGIVKIQSLIQQWASGG